jgi:hypothetical protein
MSVKIPIEDILKRYNINENGCWIYNGVKTTHGYGQHAPCILVHRTSYEYYIGSIPKGLCVLHKCDNPPCINPDHLFLGTQRDNMRDKGEKLRTWNRLSTIKVISIYKCRGTPKSIGRVFNVANSTVCNIKNLKFIYVKKIINTLFNKEVYYDHK